MAEQYTLASYDANSSPGGLEIFGKAAGELPSAAVEFAQEAWDNKGRTLLHAGEVLATSAVLGTAIGYLVPARGPAAMLIGAGFMAPAVWHAGKAAHTAYSLSLEPGANQKEIAHALAKDTISGTYNLGLNMAGGMAGAEFGFKLAANKGTLGSLGNLSQRGILKAENETMVLARNMFSKSRVSEGGLPPGGGGSGGGTAFPNIDIKTASGKTGGNGKSDIVNVGLDTQLTGTPVGRSSARSALAIENLPIHQRIGARLAMRTEQYKPSTATPEEFNLYIGSTHGHSQYSDGTGLPPKIFDRAKKDGYDFMTISDHTHKGVRSKDNPDAPNLAEEPTQWTQLGLDAEAATVNGEFVAFRAQEVGKIGKISGHKSEEGLVGGLGEEPHIDITVKMPKETSPPIAGKLPDEVPGTVPGEARAGAKAGETTNGAKTGETIAGTKPGDTATGGKTTEQGGTTPGDNVPGSGGNATGAGDKAIPGQTPDAVAGTKVDGIETGTAKSKAGELLNGDLVALERAQTETFIRDVAKGDLTTIDNLKISKLLKCVEEEALPPGLTDKHNVDILIRQLSEGELPPGVDPAKVWQLVAQLKDLRANHINIFEVKPMYETVRGRPELPEQELTAGLLDSGKGGEKVVKVNAAQRRRLEELESPEVVQLKNGDYKGLADHLDGIKDISGETPVIQMNHMRFKADESPNLPIEDRAVDYGQKSFKSTKEWLDRFVHPYVRMMEIISGPALTPGKIDVVPSRHIDHASFQGYLGKGVEAGPTAGFDFHHGDPGAHPGGTGILSKTLDKASLLDAIRQRRTMATTSRENLLGTMWANDNIPMGSILDAAAVPELNIAVNVAGKVTRDANYYAKLYQKQIHDPTPSEVLQQFDMTGADLKAAGSVFKFDAIKHRLGENNAYYVEVGRTDPISGHTDQMFLSPIWVRPMTGGVKHSLAMRLLSGNPTQFILPGDGGASGTVIR